MASQLTITIVQSGTLTTVQDLGRPGFQRFGVTPGGAADSFAARVANLLVGNPENAALLELTLLGPDLVFSHDALVALVGAEFTTDAGQPAIPRGRPTGVAGGSRISLGAARTGLRAWLAVAGGIEVPSVLESRSTDLRSRMGGQQGRAVLAGDRLKVNDPPAWARNLMSRFRRESRRAPSWFVSLGSPPATGSSQTLRFLPGPEYEAFTEEARRRLVTGRFRVSRDADRMGVRLEGLPLEVAEASEIISSGVATGVVQVPPDGHPRILLADRQTIGGYPRLAVVPAIDWPLLAQLRPGTEARFLETTLDQAHDLLVEREADLDRARVGLGRLCLA